MSGAPAAIVADGLVKRFGDVGLSVKDAETAQAASFPILAPLVFASSAFVPVTLGLPAGTEVLKALAWIVGIVAVFAPLAVAKYRKLA